MKHIITCVIAILGFAMAHAQMLNQAKVLNDSTFRTDATYQQGNKYVKDALLFMEMLADTHPFYVKKSRQAQLWEKKDALLKKCADCTSDSVFVTYLYDVLGPLHDKHTDLIDTTTLALKQAQKQQKQAEAATTATGVMAKGKELFAYRIFEEPSICYLQFNQCADARTMRNPNLPRFDEMLNRMFHDMDSLKVATLVVDAQYNNGGSSMLCDELLVRLYPLDQLKTLSTSIRFSKLMAEYNPRIGVAKTSWENDGHAEDLYAIPSQKPSIPNPPIFGGKVVFVQSATTYSSAGILMTLARDNKVGEIIGETSTFAPSHYGEILPYRLPHTGVVGTISCKYFSRPDVAHIDDATLEPDVKLDLSDKEATWQYILTHYGKK
ncbi:MAG: S41 family peptidase [Bacteroidales bacterium]|nr:S41 family peptidase [Bacteroidales bacterium]